MEGIDNANVVSAALSRGYSLDDIADKLSEQAGFEPSAVRGRGYDSAAILGKLGYPVPPQVPVGGIPDPSGAESRVGENQIYATHPDTHGIQFDQYGQPIPLGVSTAVEKSIAAQAHPDAQTDNATALAQKLSSNPTAPTIASAKELALNNPASPESQDKLAADSAQGLITPEMSAPQTDVGSLESLGRGAMVGEYGLARDAGMLASLPAIAADAVDSLVHGSRATAAQDYVFKNWVDANQTMLDRYGITPEESQGTLAKVAYGLGGMVASLPYMIASGGAGEAAIPALTDTSITAIGKVISNGFDTARPLMMQSGIDKAKEVLDSGGSIKEAVASGTAAALTTGYMMSGPMSAEGAWMKRMASGAPMYAGLAEASRIVQNFADPQQNYQPFSLDNLAVEGVTGGALALAMGHKPQEPLQAKDIFGQRATDINSVSNDHGNNAAAIAALNPDYAQVQRRTQADIMAAPDIDTAIDAAHKGNAPAKTVADILREFQINRPLPEVQSGRETTGVNDAESVLAGTHGGSDNGAGSADTGILLPTGRPVDGQEHNAGVAAGAGIEGGALEGQDSALQNNADVGNGAQPGLQGASAAPALENRVNNGERDVLYNRAADTAKIKGYASVASIRTQLLPLTGKQIPWDAAERILQQLVDNGVVSPDRDINTGFHEVVKNDAAPDQPLDGGIMFSRANNERQTLIIQHNLSEDNLLHAQRMGGIPVPSLAIARAEQPMHNFGDITMLGGIDMADPKGYAATKVFGADIYSPRYPEISYKLDNAALYKLNKILAPYRDRGGRAIYGSEISDLDDLANNTAFRKYAEEQIGKTGSWSAHQALATKILHEIGAEERIFKGYTDKGNRRYIPHTLDNVVGMLKKELRGGENYNYGVGSVRSAFTPQFKSIKQIKDARDRLIGTDQFKQVREEIERDLFALADQLAPYHPASGRSFGHLDTVTSALYDAAKMGLPRALKENGFDDVPPEVQKEAALFLNKLRDLPSEYFEAKILRAVGLSEFKGAVIPHDATQDVRDALHAHGIKNIAVYERGNQADRSAKIQQLAKESDLMFSRGSEYSLSTITKEDALSALTHGMRKAAEQMIARADAGQRGGLSFGTEAENLHRAATMMAEQNGTTPDAERAKLDKVMQNSVSAQTDTPAFKRWSGGLPVIEMDAGHEFRDGDGVVVQALHGTTGDFSKFDKHRATSDSDLGAGFYFTNNAHDVSENYAGLGPDLTARFQRVLADIADATYLPTNDPSVIKEARKRLAMEHGGMVMPVFIRMQDPLVLGGSHETRFDFKAPYNESTDTYSDATGSLISFLDTLKEVANGFQKNSADYLIGNIYTRAIENDYSISAREILSMANEDGGHLYDVIDEQGNMDSHEVLRKAFEQYGYDGIIDQTVNDKFGDGSNRKNKMAGVDADTVHFVAFQPNQIKSSLGNNGKFSSRNPDISKSMSLDHDLQVHRLQDKYNYSREDALHDYMDGKRIDDQGKEHHVYFSQENGVHVNAFYHPDIGQVFVNTDRVSSHDVPGVLLHEISHAANNDKLNSEVMHRLNVAEAIQRGFLGPQKSVAPTWYSQLSRAIGSAPDKVFGHGKLTSEWLTANAAKLGVKKAEIEATGLDDWLKMQGKVSKADVQNFLGQNGVQVKEVTLGGDISDAKKRFNELVSMRDDATPEELKSISAEQDKLEKEINDGGLTKFTSYQLPGGPLSRDTEILTHEGWKRIDAVEIGEEVLTRRDDDAGLEWAEVEAKPEVYAEKLYHFANQSINMRVTACHKMVVKRRRRSQQGIFRVTAQELWSMAECVVPLTGKWHGDAAETIYDLPAKDVAELIGWYIAEGSPTVSPTGHKSTLAIAQSREANSVKCARIEALIDRLGFKWNYSGGQYYLSIKTMPRGLVEMLHAQGKSGEKYVPGFMFDFSPEILQSLLDGLLLGDGCIAKQVNRKPRWTYFTNSKQLADDVQVLALFTGKRGTIKQRPSGLYTVGINSKQWSSVDDAKHAIVDYNDTAYCVTVKNHAIYVRTNGVAAFTGNSNYKELLLTLPEHGTKTPPTIEDWYARTHVREFNELNQRERELAESQYERDKGVFAENKNSFRSSHYDQPNILAHVRFNERTDAEGKRVLFLEELQSDWGQKGKKEGFASSYSPVKDGDVWKIKNGDTGKFTSGTNGEETFFTQESAQERIDRLKPHAIPSAPFVTDTKAWTALALKRMIRYASENGFDKISWTTGEQQADRYDLSKQVRSISYKKYSDGTYGLHILDNNGRFHAENKYPESELENVVGKEVAQKIIDGEGDASQTELSNGDVIEMKRLSGLDLKVGGEGMKGYYDAIVPQVANDILKKLGGGKVEVVNFFGNEDGKTFAQLTDEYKEVLKRAEYEIGRTYRKSEMADMTEPDMIVILRRQLDLPELATELETKYRASDSQADDALDQQQGFTITPALRAKVMNEGLPLFSKDHNGDANKMVNIYDRVRARMEAAGETGNAKEATSYLVEEAMNMGRTAGHSRLDSGFWAWATKNLPPSVVETLKQWIAAIRAAMFRNGIALKEKDLSIDDFVAIAKANMRNLASGKMEAAGGNEPVVGSQMSRGIPKEGIEKPKKGGPTFVKRGDVLDEQAPGVLAKVGSRVQDIKDGLSALKNLYTKEPQFSDRQKIIDKYLGAVQINDFELSKIAKEINLRIPADRQKAMTRYAQAGGDDAKLNEWIAGAHPEYKKEYQDALTLTKDEKDTVDFINRQQEEFGQKAVDAGILESLLENYVRQQWKTDNQSGKNMQAVINSGMMNDHPREAMHRVFEDYYTGEKLGFVPVDTRIGYQFVAGQRAIRNAIAAREALAGLMHSVEKDGRPTVSVGGGGSMIGEDTADKPYFVKPNMLGKDVRDYQTIDHPALRRWKWVGADTAGKPILMQGNMYLHPDFFGGVVTSQAKALFGTSAVRTSGPTISEKIPLAGGLKIGDAMLRSGAFVKGTILIGPFHQFHLGEHAVFHGVNPLDTPEIDFEKRPLLREGVEHGLMLYNHNAMFEFAEGLASGGLIHWMDKQAGHTLQKAGVDYSGETLKHYQEWLFQDYIPRLKAAMFEHAVARAEIYYAKDLASGKLTRDQLLSNAAKQGNAAFGELNYKSMGRNPTYQDALRLALLAPDFLEARFKFAGQALRPRGKEQAMAFIRGALIMSLGAQTINAMFGDDKDKLDAANRWSARAITNRMHWDRPFSVVINGREYSPRSVPADMLHLITDLRGFWLNRINPLWGKPVWELASGNDRNGQMESFKDCVKNVLKGFVPIPVQGGIRNNEGQTTGQAILSTLLQSIGVSNSPAKTPAEKMVGNIAFGHRTLAGETAQQQKKYDGYKDLKNDYMLGKLNSMDDVKAKAKENNLVLSKGQQTQIQLSRDTSPEGKQLVLEHRMESFTGDELLQVYEKMDSDERKTYKPFMLSKISKTSSMTGPEKLTATQYIQAHQ